MAAAELRVYLSKRVLIQLPMGFASGLPYLLSSTTLTTWMAVEGVDIKTVGFFALTQLPYSFKFLWAPLLDRWHIPLLGRRRGWMLILQLLLSGVIAACGMFDPRQQLVPLALMSVATAFLSATQDIMIDAYRADSLSADERAAGSVLYTQGYRIGMVLAGAVALVLAKYMSWRTVYLIMGAAMSCTILGTILAPEPPTERPPRTLADAVVTPFLDLLQRRNIVLCLVFVLLYRFGHTVLINMTQPFLVKIGFATDEIGKVNKGLGLACMIAGGLLAGGMVARLGVRRALLLFGIIAAAIHLTYTWLAVVGKVHWVFIVTVAVDHFCTGLAIAPFDAYILSLCNKRYSATQYALLTSFSGLAPRLIGAWAGVLAAYLGWPMFFVATLVLAIPGIVLQPWLPGEAPIEDDQKDQTSTDVPSAARTAK
jgi:PAT family beta-lactamase induction signal transducer AmpG